MIDESFEPQCKLCGDTYDLGRLNIGYAICMPCGNEIAKSVKRTVVPMNKSNYMMVTDMSILKQLNPKRTI
jgi:ribosomal protein L37AE/L43A